MCTFLTAAGSCGLTSRKQTWYAGLPGEAGEMRGQIWGFAGWADTCLSLSLLDAGVGRESVVVAGGSCRLPNLEGARELVDRGVSLT